MGVQIPRRVLQVDNGVPFAITPAHCELLVQNGKHPAASGPALCCSQYPVHTFPGAHPPVASLVAAGLHARVHTPCPASRSNGTPVKQVLPGPPHCDCSLDGAPLLHAAVQNPAATIIEQPIAPEAPQVMPVHGPPAATPMAIAEHAEPEHVEPDAHARPQLPQFAGSIAVSTQRPAHAVCPVGHTN